MKKYLLFAVLVVILVPSAAAQDKPKADVHIGYVLGIVDDDISTETTNGLGFNIHTPVNNKLGFVFDLSTNWGSVDGPGSNVDFSAQTLLAGIRLTQRGEKADGFFHVMGGVGRLSVLGVSTTEPALGIGGGFDVRIRESLYYRVVQVDYVPVFVFAEALNNFKIQTGLQFRF